MSETSSISEQTGIRSYEEYKQTRTVSNTLGKDDFLSLLAVQLQYQNPLEPMSDTDFVAQLAQFSSLEQLQTMADSLSSMTSYQYYSLTGQYVYAEVTLDTGESVAVRGVVDRVIISDGKAYAQVGDYIIDASKITQVYDKDVITNNTLLENASLIGKYVRAYTAGEGDEIATTSGWCTRVTMDGNSLVAYLDSGEKVYVGDIFDVSDTEIIVEETGGGETNPTSDE